MNRVIALLAVLGSTFIFGCGRDEIKMMDSPPCMVPPCTFDAVNDPHTKLPEETKTELTIDYSVWQPPSRILVAGGDVWHNIVQYKACAKGDKGVQILRLNALTNAGYNFWAVGVAQNGAVRGITVINGTNGDIDLLAKPIPVPAGNCINFELWGKLANVQSSSSVAGSKQAPRSGNVISLGINAGLVNGRWDVAYTNHLNVEAYDTTSGARVLVEGKPLLSDKLPFSFMVMRKSKPYINRIPALNPPLEGGKEATLYTHQVSADTFGGAVSVKRMTYAVSIAYAAKSTMSLKGFRLFRGGVDITDQVTIKDFRGHDLTKETFEIDTVNLGHVQVTWKNEETVNGPGNVYSLKAMVAGNVVTGDSISVLFSRGNTTTAVTGTYADIAKRGGTFIWSDQSEVPHGEDSIDWTDEALVEDMTQVQVLAR